VGGTNTSKPSDDKSEDDAEDCDDAEDSLCSALLRCCFSLYFEGVSESLSFPSYFPRHPFADGFPGYLRLDYTSATLQADRSLVPPELLDVRLWSCRVAVEESNDFDGLNRVGGHVLVDTSYRIGALVKWNIFHERLDGGRTDQLFLGDANVFVGLLRLQTVQDRLGVGVRVMSDEHDVESGFNVLYGLDWYPCRPWIFSEQIDFGTLGEAGVFHFRATVGAIFSHGEVFAGYDALWINHVRLAGPVIGLRLWF
jgi:hypothetical protein